MPGSTVKLKESKRTHGWMGIKRGHNAHPIEWIAEKLIALISLSAIVMIFLIFVFIAREALPVFLGRMNSSPKQEMIPPEKMDSLKPEELRTYLGLTPTEFAEMERETKVALMEVKVEAVQEVGDSPDADINTTEWRYLLFPYKWEGYDKPEYIWQPVGTIHKYNIVPLLIGSLKISLIAIFLAVPLAIGQPAIPGNSQAGDRNAGRHSLGGAWIFRLTGDGVSAAINFRI